MFGVGFGELIIIFIVALIVLGPKRLPEFARTVARVYREIMGTVNEVKSTVLDDTVKGIPKDYIPPHMSNRWDIEEDNTKNDSGEGIKKGMREYQNIDLNNYEPKREKISFKKNNENKEDVNNVSKDK